MISFFSIGISQIRIGLFETKAAYSLLQYSYTNKWEILRQAKLDIAHTI
ncbi:hypothetical protein LX73_0157 [Fodinibius salinus]|uniref:Uncharacterized protein n=1 Tax=Fodinibius salinus TaxID=860790 RepID=A0A5D3YM01_9BACT|nr:hypothetical protein LX73_0157 [Fodinibius salinus]